MRLFLELTRRSFRRYLTYRGAVVAGLVTNFFFGIFRMAILVALYGGRESVAGVDVQGGITYMVLIQAVIGYLAMFSWFQLMQSVHTGEIAADLLKPIDIYAYWLAQDLGRAVVQFLLRGALIVLLYLPFFDLTFPSGAAQWAGLSLSLVFSWLVSFAWRFLVNATAFWSPQALGFIRLAAVVSWFFSGFLMPLRYYPDWVMRVANFTPFPSMVNTLMDIWVGAIIGREMLAALGVQALWIAALVLAGQWALRAGVRRLVILGG
jgi:ABC-2 type transport system permease protein